MKKYLLIVVLALVVAGAYFTFGFYESKNEKQRAATEWELIKNDTVTVRFDEFLNKYPGSDFAHLAHQRRDSLQMEADWKAAVEANTLDAYQDFQQKYTASPHAEKATTKIAAFELEAAWQSAREKNTIAAYNDFLSRYPQSKQAPMARKKIIDLEVEKIFAGQHGQLPPPQKTSSGSSQTNHISIENQTDYTLTIRYSGNRSIKVVLKAHGSDAITLPSGAYKVAASVNHPNVIPFAGAQNLSGGEYSSIYYISGL